MAERKWGSITSGANFEALATTIVYFEDPKAALFGRRGKDGGQDARSGDGTRVFQAKHHESGSAASAISDAKKEAAKIEGYRQPGHARHAQWQGVTHWRLVTNATFNPTDKQKWDTQVVPAFTEQGLTADYWERQNLEALLDKHPEIHRSFFENETRAFLSLPEVKERLPAQEPFLRRDELGPFCGRAEEKTALRAFLASDKLFLVVHGAGGTGKTRFVVDAGDEIAGEGEWQVLWGNVESMTTTGSWFEAIDTARATMLIVDEPSGDSVLQQLAEQLGGRVGRANRWKVVVAVRSPKDPVLRFLRGARMRQRVQELPLSPLPQADSEEMAFELLSTGRRTDWSDETKREAARRLSQRFSRYPVWLTLAIQHLEDQGDLKNVPESAEALADEYLLEIEQGQSNANAEEIRTLLRWVALVGTVNREDDSAVKLIGEPCGLTSLVEVRARLAALVQRRALTERGARNRFVELKPDVLRDHVLLRWLARDVGAGRLEVSDEGKQLLQAILGTAANGTLNPLGRAILTSLSRTEFLLRLAGHEVGLLETFFGGLEQTVPTMTASQLLTLPDVIEAIAHFHPRAATSLVRALRMHPTADETIEGIFGPKVVRQADVVLALAWPLFGAAMGAQADQERDCVLRELCDLAKAEADIACGLPRGLPNDGKRAAALVTRVLEGGPQFWTEYDDTAAKLSKELIDALTNRAPSNGEAALLKALIPPLLETQRHQTWSEDNSLQMRMFTIAPGGTAWQAREAVLCHLKGVLTHGNLPTESLVELWRVFSQARDGEDALARLEWTHEVLTSRTSPPTVDELGAARDVWHWHLHYDDRPDVKAAAQKLEALYASNDLAREFEPLVPSIEEWREKGDRVAAKAAELSEAADARDLDAFLDRAVAFGGDALLLRLGGIAWSLGARATSREKVREFIEASLQRSSVTPREEFIVAAAVSWVAAVRKTEPAQTHMLVTALLAKCVDDNRRAHLLERLYGRVPKLKDVGDFTPDEHALLRGSCGLFTSTGRAVQLVAALALTVDQEWATLRPVLDGALQAVPSDQRRHAAHALVDAIYWAVREEGPTPPPKGLAEWLLTQLLTLPDFDDLGGNGEWHLAEIIKRLGTVELRWLPGALAQRQQQEAKAKDAQQARAVSRNIRISKFVKKITGDDSASPTIAKAVGEVLDLIKDNGSLGYYLPEMLRDIDPEGFVVPNEIAARASSASDAEGVRRLARIGGAYAINSAPWRTIALATIRAASPLGSDALRAVYGALGVRGIRSWSGAVGEVPPIFLAAVDDARANLDGETYQELRPYWQQRLAIAEADLREQEQHAKEDRGE
ncbi:ATP-binding protein [Corallococcus exercitus]|uniref:ATP-binding protein n=1 Tax=Corallococcus exercitus TaxID=2316736 RepID=A0A7Y4JW06_9BACT|nr:ATP-binding protein [Corallococcus exercitus]NOK12155.1 ATP-binding protein [Corallococcus exercitus]